MKKKLFKNRGIFSLLVKNYILFLLLFITVITISYVVVLLQVVSVADGQMPKLTASVNINDDYKNLDTEDIEALDGWVEILDENKHLIYTKGNKKDSKTDYQEEDLFNFGEKFDKDDSKIDYIIIPQTFRTSEGKLYYCLAKYPSDKIAINADLKLPPYKVGKVIYDAIIKGALIFVLLLILNIIIYSIWTARKIINPLQTITQAMLAMVDGEPDIRLELNAEKEFMIISNTFNYMADKLRTSEKEKQTIEDSKTRMLLDLSHDIKTPITVIQGYAKTLSDGMVNDETQKQRYYETIYRKSEMVSELVDDLFEFVKLESCDYKLAYEHVDFAEFIRKILAEFYDELEEKNYNLDIRIPDEALFVSFDQKLIKRAISNIITNAIKYNAEGTTVRVEILSQNENLVLEIADSGKGIPEAIKETLFDAFVRGDTSRKSDGGTGLGLAIANKIFQRHGWCINLAEGSENEKTVFSILLNNAACANVQSR